MAGFNPYEQEIEPIEMENSFRAETLDDVVDWLYSDSCPLGNSARSTYRRALHKVGKLEQRSLNEIRASSTCTWFLSRYPNANYVKTWGKTFEAAKRWKRNVAAAINGATGEIAARRERRSRRDGWADLIGLLAERVEEGKFAALPLREEELIGVRSTADTARRLSVQPFDIDPETASLLYRSATGQGAKKSATETLVLLDRLGESPDHRLEALLPVERINFVPPTRKETVVIPMASSEELETWVEVATRGTWSITDEKYLNGVCPKPYRCAARKVLTTAARTGLLDLGSLPTIAGAFDTRVLVEVVRKLREGHSTGTKDAIGPRAARGYLEVLIPFLERNGETADTVRMILATDEWIGSASRSRNRMTPQARSFCRRVVTDRTSRLEFLSQHISFRSRATNYLRAAMQAEESAAKALLEKARRYGTCAAFAALETDAVPVRVSNALNASYRGDAAWLHLGVKPSSDGYLFVPASEVKNGEEIRAPISATSQLRGLETLRWFERTIRPLFPQHAGSDQFFPAVMRPGEPLPYATFKSWWSKCAAECGFPGMTPHMFRHGQASILAAKNPGNWALISARIGDTEAVCRANYAWIDHEQLIVAGQQLLTADLPHAA